MKFELAFPYEIHIIPTVNGGVIARVGCAELSFASTNKLLTAMREYFGDPEGAEKAYNEIRKTITAPVADHGGGPTTRAPVGLGNTLATEPPEAPNQVEETEQDSAETAGGPGEDL